VIEYKVWPYCKDEWNRDHPFYLEVFGQARPRLSHGYARIPLSEGNGEVEQGINRGPLYEYCWSLGYIDLDRECGPDRWGGELADTAAEVVLYFPTTGGWRIEELLATIKYLCPGREHASLLHEAGHMFATAQPIVEDASKLAAAGRWLPGVGPVTASTAQLLDVIARLKVTSVPPAKGYEWSVEKVTQHIQGEGLLHGIKWIISKKLFVEFGSRLTGSIAVNVVPSILQSSSQVSDHVKPTRDYVKPRPLPIRAKAVMHLHPERLRGDSLAPAQRGEPISLPEDGFLELEIEPRASAAVEPRVGTPS
jgi:hypothetical protein